MPDTPPDGSSSGVTRRRFTGVLLTAAGLAVSAALIDLAGDYVAEGAGDLFPYLTHEPLYALLLALPFFAFGVVPLVVGIVALALSAREEWTQAAVGVAVAAPLAILTSLTGIAVLVGVDQREQGSVLAWGVPMLVVGWLLMASVVLVSWPRGPALGPGMERVAAPAAWIGSVGVMFAFGGLQLLMWLPFSFGSAVQVLWWVSAFAVMAVCVVHMLRSWSRLSRNAASALMFSVGGYECLVALALMSPAFFGLGIVVSLPLWVAGGLAVTAGWQARASAQTSTLAQDAT